MYNIQDIVDFNQECDPIREELEYALYFDRFIKYYPKYPYHVKRGYDSAFYQVNNRKTKKPVPLGGDYLHQSVEQHLNNERYCTENNRSFQPFWLGLHKPDKCRENCIDIDAKDFLVTKYKLRGVVYPLHIPNLNHFKTLRRLYNHFPGRIWCISSRTLGMHLWQKTDLVSTDLTHQRVKGELAEIGLDNIEVHPMQGRCLRRPFGLDYHVITTHGELSIWQRQITYYLEDHETPAFDHIVKVLLRHCWLNYHQCVHPMSTIEGKYPSQVPGRLSEVTEWLERGCPDKEVISVGFKEESPESLIEPVIESEKETVSKNPYSMRDREYPKWLRWHAKHGLTEPDSFNLVAYEIAKYLWFVELYSDPDKSIKIVDMLKHWIGQKHNGMVSRISNGEFADVVSQIERIVVAASEIRDPESLELFARIRHKRDSGQYERLINLAPILGDNAEPGATPDTNSLPSVLLILGRTPSSIEEIIAKVLTPRMLGQIEGEHGVFPFARNFLGYLWSKKGSARIDLKTLIEWSDNKSQRTVWKYKELLVKAGLLEDNWQATITRGKACSLYRMTPLCQQRFEEEFQQERSAV